MKRPLAAVELPRKTSVRGTVSHGPIWVAGRGSVTAEFAVLLPAVTALLALLLLGAGAGILQLRLEEGARAGARALARGETSAQAGEIARTLSGGAGTVTVDLAGGYATVVVTGRMSGPLASIIPWRQSAKASARLENNEPQPALSTGPQLRLTGMALSTLELTGRLGVPPRKTALWRWAHAPHTVPDVMESVRRSGSWANRLDADGTYRCQLTCSDQNSPSPNHSGTDRDGDARGGA